jgi:hypothetical protein
MQFEGTSMTEVVKMPLLLGHNSGLLKQSSTFAEGFRQYPFQMV